jgi:methyl-accepting chemotaxis protein
MAAAVGVFKDNMLEAERLRAEQSGNEQRAAAQRKADMHKLADEFQAAVGAIVDTVSSASTELEAAAGTLTRTAEVTQELSGTVAAASEQASANVQSVASSTEEMTSSVNEISRQVQESSKIAVEAVRQAQQTDVRINQLSQAAGRIGDVVKLITAIAEQTNLLALNATIEAARAGEAGRGFAVVASEVKQLASQTAKATDEISTQIAGMQTATQDSVAAIKEIGGTIGRISEIASTIAAAVEEQGAATQEIARNVGEAAKGTQQVASNITDVNRGASETGSASAQVLSSAQSLSHESNHLKAEVDKFLMTVRAA